MRLLGELPDEAHAFGALVRGWQTDEMDMCLLVAFSDLPDDLLGPEDHTDPFVEVVVPRLVERLAVNMGFQEPSPENFR